LHGLLVAIIHLSICLRRAIGILSNHRFTLVLVLLIRLLLLRSRVRVVRITSCVCIIIWGRCLTCPLDGRFLLSLRLISLIWLACPLDWRLFLLFWLWRACPLDWWLLLFWLLFRLPGLFLTWILIGGFRYPRDRRFLLLFLLILWLSLLWRWIIVVTRFLFILLYSWLWPLSDFLCIILLFAAPLVFAWGSSIVWLLIRVVILIRLLTPATILILLLRLSIMSSWLLWVLKLLLLLLCWTSKVLLINNKMINLISIIGQEIMLSQEGEKLLRWSIITIFPRSDFFILHHLFKKLFAKSTSLNWLMNIKVQYTSTIDLLHLITYINK